MWTVSTTPSWNFHQFVICTVNPSNAKLNPICHLLALLGAHHILHISRIRVNEVCVYVQEQIIVIQFNEVSTVDGLCSGVSVAVIN
jgi:hypothetical protein